LTRALLAGFATLRCNPGLVLLVLGTNLGVALLLAVPFALELRDELAHRGAASAMMYGFDLDWWTRFQAGARGAAGAFGPDLLGTGFAWRNLDLLLRGHVPGGLFATDRGPGALLLGAGFSYLLLQVCLAGGLLGVFRAPAGGWTFRGIVHGSGFYFGRLARVTLLGLAAAGVAFALHAPLAGWLGERAREAVDGRSALALTLAGHGLLLLALALVHMVASHARVLVVREERRSALLAVASSAGFCRRHFAAAFGQYVVVAGLGGLLLAAFAFLDARLPVTGWRSQAFALVLFQALAAARIALRLGLLASQLELQEEKRR
jgi:hypothetical protein